MSTIHTYGRIAMSLQQDGSAFSELMSFNLLIYIKKYLGIRNNV